MILLNTILLPFQAGYENIVTASGKPRELFVIKRIFENNHYRYDLQLDDSLFSRWDRVSVFAKGVALCLPFIGHIISIALRCFSSSIFPELPLDFAMKCSPKQKLDIAKFLYTEESEKVDQATRLRLAKILANDQRGFILLAKLSCLDLMANPKFSIDIIQEKPELLDEIEKYSPDFLKYLTKNFNFYQFGNEEFALAIIQKEPELLNKIDILECELANKILSLLEKLTSEQKLVVAKQFYRCQPEIDPFYRLVLAKILANNEEGLDVLLDNLSYLDLTSKEDFLKFIQEIPQVLEAIKVDLQVAEQIFVKITDLELKEILNDHIINFLENSKSCITKQLLLKEAMDYKFITNWLSCLCHNQDLIKALVKELILQAREVELSDKTKLAIIHALTTLTNNNFIEDLLKDQDINTTLANILLRDKDYYKLVINNIEYLDLLQNTRFNQELFQMNPILKQVKDRFFTQMMEQDPIDPEFIVNWFNVLNFNETTKKELIRDLLDKMDFYSEQVEIAIARVIIEKHSRGPKFLLENIDKFTHTQELANILLNIPDGSTYITDNIDKFNLSEEQRDNLLEKCTPSALV